MGIDLQERVVSIVADVFSLPRQTVTLASSPATIEAWDSLGHLNLVLALEQELGVKFTPEEMEDMGNVQQCLAIVTAKVGGPDWGEQRPEKSDGQ